MKEAKYAVRNKFGLGVVHVFFFFSFLDVFLMWTIFEVFIEFVSILLLFHIFIFGLQGMWDLSSRTRDRTHKSYIGKQILNHWATREVPLCTSHLSFSFLSQSWINAASVLSTPRSSAKIIHIYCFKISVDRVFKYDFALSSLIDCNQGVMSGIVVLFFFFLVN